MIHDVKVPPLSESISEATLLTWNRQVGEAVTRDESLIEIETDKVVLEIPAPAEGTLIEIIKPDGTTVYSGDIIAKIDTTATKPDTPKQSTSDATATENAATTASSPTPIVMPAAQTVLANAGLTPEGLSGSGRDGRITKSDAEQAVALHQQLNERRQGTTHPENHDALASTIDGDRPEQRVPMSRLRARVAERLLQSQHENAILTTFNEVNMAPIIALRKKYGEKFAKVHGVKLGFMSFFIKAAVAALDRYPILNASVEDNNIVYHGYYDIGIAVGSPRGLVVPIIRNVDQKSMAEVEKQITEFGEQAQNGKLTMEALSGGTFSISNGGVFGSMLSTPIINPPQSAILGIHATKDRPVVENGEIVIRPMNYLALSYDHRIIDGRDAVLGLCAIKEALEDPARILLDI